MKTLKTLKDRDRGANMVEYGLMVAVIALVALAAVTLLGDQTETTFTTAAAAFETGPASDGGTVASADGSDADAGDTDNTSGAGTESGDTGDGSSDIGDGSSDTGSTPGDDEQGYEQQADPDQIDQGETTTDDSGQGQVDDGATSGDDANNGKDDGNGSGTTEPVAASHPSITATSSEFFWWNNSSTGGTGAWKASTSFKNDTDRHQYLTLEVTRIDDKGVATKTIVNSFYVPGNGSTTYTLWDNNYSLSNGVATGVVKVKVEVLSVTTSDKNWKPFSYDADPNEATVLPPAK